MINLSINYDKITSDTPYHNSMKMLNKLISTYMYGKISIKDIELIKFELYKVYNYLKANKCDFNIFPVLIISSNKLLYTFNYAQNDITVECESLD